MGRPSTSSRVVVVDDALFDQHAASSNHPERPARLDAARAGLRRVGARVEALPPNDAPRALLETVHLAEYLDELETLRGKRGMLDADTFIAPRSIDAAIRAAGGAAAIGEGLATNDAGRAIALLRPPGHHAEPDRAMGFCLLNNVAIAAMAARRAGARKVAIVDIDVHHGNGTQSMFYRDPNTLFVSLHQWPFYPGTGAVDEIGEGEGIGTTVNVPLSEGAGDATYVEAIDRIVVPALRSFDADVLLISAGFDAFAGDPIAGMRVTEQGFGSMVGALAHIAAERGAPVGMILEGGYDLRGLESCVAAATRALLDSTGPSVTGAVSGRHRAEIDRAEASQRGSRG